MSNFILWLTIAALTANILTFLWSITLGQKTLFQVLHKVETTSPQRKRIARSIAPIAPSQQSPQRMESHKEEFKQSVDLLGNTAHGIGYILGFLSAFIFITSDFFITGILLLFFLGYSLYLLLVIFSFMIIKFLVWKNIMYSKTELIIIILLSILIGLFYSYFILTLEPNMYHKWMIASLFGFLGFTFVFALNYKLIRT
jgi:hypothetical protein